MALPVTVLSPHIHSEPSPPPTEEKSGPFLSFLFLFLTPPKKRTVSKLLTIGSRFLVEREGKGAGVGFEMVELSYALTGAVVA